MIWFSGLLHIVLRGSQRPGEAEVLLQATQPVPGLVTSSSGSLDYIRCLFSLRTLQEGPGWCGSVGWMSSHALIRF